MLYDNPGLASISGYFAVTIDGNYNKVNGCFINVKPDGLTVPARSNDGIVINGSYNQIGDGTIAGLNLIGGIRGGTPVVAICGIRINTGANYNIVGGNIIGLSKDGSSPLIAPTYVEGIIVTSAAFNTIGGFNINDGNIIAAANRTSGAAGIHIKNGALGGNTIMGNTIGLTPDGNSSLTSLSATFKMDYGIYVDNSPSVLIGGGVAGARNILSGCRVAGIYITGVSSTGMKIKGNYIGTNKSGDSFINYGASVIYQKKGIWLDNTVGGVVIGGTGANEGNVISGQKGLSSYGIYIQNSTNGSTFQGNIIGLYKDGVSPFIGASGTIQAYGIYLDNSPNNLIGGSAAGARNVISGNQYDGIHIYNTGSFLNKIQGNYIGLDSSGTLYTANQTWGVTLDGGGRNKIGGALPGEGNVISGNNHGISLDASLVSGLAADTIFGNTIGLQKDGLSFISGNGGANQTWGITVDGNWDNVNRAVIGGGHSGERNVISGNKLYGILLNVDSAKVFGNYIGCSAQGTRIAGASQNYGVSIFSGRSNNIIGGSIAGESNTIAFNTIYGIYINSGNHNLISRNPIYDSTAQMTKAINLAGLGNDNYAPPAITSATGSLISGTGLSGDSVEVFKTDGGCINAFKYLGTALVSANTWTLSAGTFGLTAGDKLFATARNNTNNNTSEFCPCVCMQIPPDISSGTTICNGDFSILTAGGSTAYNWSPAVSLNTTTGSSVNASPNTPTSYTVTETVCNNTAFVTVGIIAIPAIFVSTPSVTLCSGNSATIAAYGASTYNWLPVTAISSATAATVTINPTTSLTYTITGTGSTNCPGTFQLSVAVTNNALPTISVSPALTAICSGNTTELSALGLSIKYPIAYQWRSSQVLAITSGDLITANPLTNSSYTLIGTDGNGCYNTTFAMIYVNANPTVDISASNGTICAGSTPVVLTANGANTYSWNASITLSNTTGLSITENPAVSTSYTVTGTDSNFCSDKATISIVVNPLPTLTASSAISICEGQTATLSASGADIFTWQSGTTPSNIPVVSVSPVSSTTYTVIGNNTNGCRDTAFVDVIVRSITIVDAGSNLTVSYGTLVTLVATSGGATYDWTPAVATSCGSCQTTTVIANQNQKYFVTLTNENECSSIDSVTIYVYYACADLFVPNAFSPNNDGENDVFGAYIQNKENCFDEFVLEVYDQWGNKIFISADINDRWNGTRNGQEMDTDVYVYHVHGRKSNREKFNLSGNVSLIK